MLERDERERGIKHYFFTRLKNLLLKYIVFNMYFYKEVKIKSLVSNKKIYFYTVDLFRIISKMHHSPTHTHIYI